MATNTRMIERLQELRKDHKLSQTQLGNIIGMTQTGYSKYETAENRVPLDILEILADYYGTSVDYLIGRTDIIRPYPKSKRK